MERDFNFEFDTETVFNWKLVKWICTYLSVLMSVCMIYVTFRERIITLDSIGMVQNIILVISEIILFVYGSYSVATYFTLHLSRSSTFSMMEQTGKLFSVPKVYRFNDYVYMNNKKLKSYVTCVIENDIFKKKASHMLKISNDFEFYIIGKIHTKLPVTKISKNKYTLSENSNTGNIYKIELGGYNNYKPITIYMICEFNLENDNRCCYIHFLTESKCDFSDKALYDTYIKHTTEVYDMLNTSEEFNKIIRFRSSHFLKVGIQSRFDEDWKKYAEKLNS